MLLAALAWMLSGSSTSAADPLTLAELRAQREIAKNRERKPIYNNDGGDSIYGEEDAAILASHWGETDAFWGEGDFNGDGRVDVLDAAILAANWQRPGEATAETVPEPSAFILIAGMLTAIGPCRTRGWLRK
jgi:hypothetical protein